MSISSMTSDFTATLKRGANATSAFGSKVLTFSTANRTADGLSTSISASFQVGDTDDKAEYGIQETDIAWCMYTATDPELETEDRVEWTDSGGKSRVCRIVGPSFDMAGKGTIWKTMVRETKNET